MVGLTVGLMGGLMVGLTILVVGGRTVVAEAVFLSFESSYLT